MQRIHRNRLHRSRIPVELNRACLCPQALLPNVLVNQLRHVHFVLRRVGWLGH
jgi:hypothetical protein